MNRVIAFLAISFSIVNTYGQCQADFYGFLDASCPTFDTVIFYDCSINATSWYWDFGDSTTSTDQNPVHQYDIIGSYNVCLIITDGALCSDTICKTIWVSTCGTDFYHAPTVQPNTIKFFDTPTNAPYYPTDYFWDFGDSSYSNLRLPVHTYNSPGIYHVSLLVHDSINGCVIQVCKDISVTPPVNTSISVCDGYWNDPYTWNTGQVPSSTDSIIIYNHVVISSDILIGYPGLIYVEENSSLCSYYTIQSVIMTYGVLNTDILIICNSDSTNQWFSYSDFIPANITNMWQVGCGFANGTYLMQSWPSGSPYTCSDPLPCLTKLNDYQGYGLLISPNPFENIAEIVFNNPEHESFDINIYNTHGIRIKTIKNIYGSTYQFSRENIAGGMYLIHLIKDNMVVDTLKVIIN